MASVFKRGGKGNRGGFWYIAYHEWVNGRLRRRTKCSRTTDKATAERIANKYEADAALRREGVVDAALEAIGKESQRSVELHVVDYKNKLEAAGRTIQYVKETIKYIREIAKAKAFELAVDINADDVNQFAAELKDKNKSARTIQAYLTSIKGFTKWLAKHHKLPRDPLASVQKPSPDTDRRLERRMLLSDEWYWLEATTAAKDEECYGMTATERVLLYKTAIQTGLRSGELRSLTRGRLYFDSEPPYVTCKAGSTKNRHEARQYIRRDLAEGLRALVTSKVARAPVFNLPDESKVASMFRADLAGARAAWLDAAKENPQEYSRRQESDFLMPVNHEGETADFHSLRHTCGAWLAMAGVHPKAVQSIMRHSSITLTMDTYGHLFPGQEAEAIDKFSRFMGDGPQPLAATGTCDTKPASRSARRSAQGAIQCNASGTGCNDLGEPATVKFMEKTNNSRGLCNAVPSSTIVCNPTAPLAQLAEQLTLNQ